MSASQPEPQHTAPVVWCVGLTTLDVIHRVTEPPNANQKVTAVRQDVAAGGPAANAAVTAAALGATAVLISALGDSPIAAAAKADLAAHEVKMLDVTADAAQPYPLAVSSVTVTDENGERTVVSADAALTTVAGPTSGDLTAIAKEYGYPAVVLLDGHHPEIARAVVDWVENTVIPGQPEPRIVLDCGRWRPVFAELFNVAEVVACSSDFVMPNSADDDDDDTTEDTIGAVLDELAQAVVVTNGGGPVRYETQEGLEGSVTVPPVTARDTLGAGDAFHGALAVAIARRGTKADGTLIDIDDILPLVIADAVAVASERVQHIGPRDWLATLRT